MAVLNKVPHERIRELRLKRFGSQRIFCNKTGMKVGHYSRCERGEQQFKALELILLAEIFGTNIDYLLGMTNEMQPYPKRL